MDGLKKIMYGVTDFPLMMRENACFVDRTALIRELEETRYSSPPAVSACCATRCSPHRNF